MTQIHIIDSHIKYESNMADSDNDLVVHQVVHFVPKEFQLDGFSDEDDEAWVMSIGDPFMYVIPSFDVLAVELRQIQIKGYEREDGKETHLDLFIRNDTSICKTYHSLIRIKDVTVVQVYHIFIIQHCNIITN